ncbi:Ankyrin repeats (3 copies) [Legionella geestiana]|uniref:Ankyrin repeats (3 copies) n=1 Tax=Legionella geestiana TaxID=45065 RepID=A0A0W0TNP3_9GAMM|nr:ankyrin repeat domain-containing protein [Legionella geestiana]KTC97234.1 Ankyrin repeats (3 copies) [Legionella geestiana]QBS12366.1 ankyrin repeat domain-containing protein [Legionella geestiana]STX55195.1 Beta-lactamase [Legionella geestiana]
MASRPDIISPTQRTAAAVIAPDSTHNPVAVNAGGSLLLALRSKYLPGPNEPSVSHSAIPPLPDDRTLNRIIRGYWFKNRHLDTVTQMYLKKILDANPGRDARLSPQWNDIPLKKIVDGEVVDDMQTITLREAFAIVLGALSDESAWPIPEGSTAAAEKEKRLLDFAGLNKELARLNLCATGIRNAWIQALDGYEGKTLPLNEDDLIFSTIRKILVQHIESLTGLKIVSDNDRLVTGSPAAFESAFKTLFLPWILQQEMPETLSSMIDYEALQRTLNEAFQAIGIIPDEKLSSLIHRYSQASSIKYHPCDVIPFLATLSEWVSTHADRLVAWPDSIPQTRREALAREVLLWLQHDAFQPSTSADAADSDSLTAFYLITRLFDALAYFEKNKTLMSAFEMPDGPDKAAFVAAREYLRHVLEDETVTLEALLEEDALHAHVAAFEKGCHHIRTSNYADFIAQFFNKWFSGENDTEALQVQGAQELMLAEIYYREPSTLWCGLLQVSTPPHFETLAAHLHDKDALVLYDDALFYVDQQAQRLLPVRVAPQTEAEVSRLKAKMTETYQVADANDIELITRRLVPASQASSFAGVQRFATPVIFITDDVLQAWRRLNEEGLIHLDVYQINRILLHALSYPSAAWSPLFRESLETVVQFIRNQFNAPDYDANQNALKQQSYPDSLLAQIDSLLADSPLPPDSEQPVLTPALMRPEESARMALYVAYAPNAAEWLIPKLLNPRAGFNPNALYKNGKSLLLLAAEAREPRFVGLLLALGARMPLLPTEIPRELQRAMANDDAATFKLLLESIPPREIREYITRWMTEAEPGLASQCAQNPELLNVLFNTVPDNDWWAESSLVYLLLKEVPEHDASLKIVMERIAPEKRVSVITETLDWYRRPLLHGALRNPKSLQYLISLHSEGERLSLVNPKQQKGLAFLHAAITNTECLETVLSIYPSREIEIAALLTPDENGKTAFHKACFRRPSLKILLNRVSQQELAMAVKMADNLGLTLLHYAAITGNGEALDIFLNALPSEEWQKALYQPDNGGETVMNLLSPTLRAECLARLHYAQTLPATSANRFFTKNTDGPASSNPSTSNKPSSSSS